MSASRRTTALLSVPRSASRTTRSVVISADMGLLPGASADVSAGGRNGGGRAGKTGGDPYCSTVHLGRGGDGRSRERRAGCSVGDGVAQPLGRVGSTEGGEHVSGEAAVACADGAAHRD